MSYSSMERKTTNLTSDFDLFLNYEYELQLTDISYWGNPLLEMVDVRSIVDYSAKEEVYRQNLIDIQRTTQLQTNYQSES
jgi:hypothetical protein